MDAAPPSHERSRRSATCGSAERSAQPASAAPHGQGGSDKPPSGNVIDGIGQTGGAGVAGGGAEAEGFARGGAVFGAGAGAGTSSTAPGPPPTGRGVHGSSFGSCGSPVPSPVAGGSAVVVGSRRARSPLRRHPSTTETTTIRADTKAKSAERDITAQSAHGVPAPDRARSSRLRALDRRDRDRALGLRRRPHPQHSTGLV